MVGWVVGPEGRAEGGLVEVGDLDGEVDVEECCQLGGWWWGGGLEVGDYLGGLMLG